MHIRIPAGPRRRTQRALIGAVLPLIAAAVALPSAAQASQIGPIPNNGRLSVTDSQFENNRLLLRVVGSEIAITDSVPFGPLSAGHPCRIVNQLQAFCPANTISSLFVDTGFGFDTVEYRLPHEGQVRLGGSNDRIIAGRREAIGRAIQPVHYLPERFFGDTALGGHDMIDFSGADRGVSLTPEDGLANDGRPGDRENVAPGFRTIVGSEFNDSPLFGTDLPEIMLGLGGNDFVAGGHGADIFPTFPGDGADDYHGGPGTDTIDYSSRNQPVTVTLDNVANDGQSGERDFVRTNVENITGGSAGDVFDSFGAFSRLDGGRGIDTLRGGDGPDTLIGGPGTDTLDAGEGHDAVVANDGERDTIDCGGGRRDVVLRDNPEQRSVGCETVQIGQLRLTPKSARVAVGDTARLRLSWRHPKAWKQLRTIELRLTRDGIPVGAITIRARGKRITGDGAVASVARGTRIVAKGKTVTARLAVRLDGSVAGATLKAEVEATDKRGRRQLETNAATIRVAK